MVGMVMRKDHSFDILRAITTFFQVFSQHSGIFRSRVFCGNLSKAAINQDKLVIIIYEKTVAKTFDSVGIQAVKKQFFSEFLFGDRAEKQIGRGVFRKTVVNHRAIESADLKGAGIVPKIIHLWYPESELILFKTNLLFNSFFQCRISQTLKNEMM
jgi:hypothetical protein